MSCPRIIGGTARGMRLRSVPGDTTRPITGRVKEAFFNIVGPDIVDSYFLDLFGGTGSVGIEALSRGAAYARLVDLNRLAVQTIKANLEHTHLSANADVIQMDSFHYLEGRPDRAFHYIYIAPPQYKDMWLRAVEAVNSSLDWLASDGWVVVQIDPLEYSGQIFSNLTLFDQRKYGSSLLLFFERSNE